MRARSLLMALVAAVILPVMDPAPAQAQATRTWVSGVGDDANPCSRTAPCKTFAGAISKTATAGEINCIDPGGFGSVTITKAMTINCESTLGSILAPGTNGVVINTVADTIVVLRGLEIEGAGSGVSGIRFIGAGVLHVHNVQIRGFRNGGNGITFTPTGPSELYVVDSFIMGNGNSAVTAGINIRPTGTATVRVYIDRTSVENNSAGIIADGSGGTGTVNGSIRDSQVAGNTNNGITASTNGTGVTLLLDNVTAAGNNFGLVAGGNNAGMLIANSQVTANTTGLLFSNSGVLLSYGNNRVNANLPTDGNFSGTVNLR